MKQKIKTIYIDDSYNPDKMLANMLSADNGVVFLRGNNDFLTNIAKKMTYNDRIGLFGGWKAGRRESAIVHIVPVCFGITLDDCKAAGSIQVREFAKDTLYRKWCQWNKVKEIKPVPDSFIKFCRSAEYDKADYIIFLADESA